MPYNYLTLGQALQMLSDELYQSSTDTTQQFWSAAEMTAYIQEALQTFNALANFWRTELVYNPSSTSFWTDITTVAGSPRPITLTDNDVLVAMEYALLEPATNAYPLAWTGSNQFSAQDLLDAIQRTRDEMLGITGCTVSQNNVAAPIATTVPLGGSSYIDVRRVAWIPTAGNNSPLYQTDDMELASFAPGYTANNSGTPTSWRQSAQPPLSFYVDNVPSVPGQYDVISVRGGGNLSTTNSTVLAIPNDWGWLVKWGSLEDVLTRASQAGDPVRADYCNKRYEEGLSVLTDAPAVLACRINNIPYFVESLRSADDFNPAWMAQNASDPVQGLYVAGLNLLAHWPLPTSNTASSVTLQVVQNAPIPQNLGDQLQLGKDDVHAVLHYAQHLASFKMGGQEFLSTIPLYTDFLKRCALYNSKLQALGTYKRPMYEVSQLHAEREPVYTLGETPAEVLK